MTKRFSIASVVLTALSALLTLLLVTSPALAHHKANHEQGKDASRSTSTDRDRDGDADSDASTAYTEDNDTNDGGTRNNVADEGDNKHPSGKDRSVENGGSGNQGNSESDPDDDGRGPDRSNGGPDKPNGSGGDDLADQDGNNGCGNDDDFEDDNEGWCGKPEEETPTVAPTQLPTPCPSPMTYPSDGCGSIETPTPDDVLGDEVEGDVEDDDVLGGVIKADDKVAGDTAAAGDDTAAAGTRQPSGAALPFTGGNVVLFLIVAMGLLGVGIALLRTRRS